MTARILVVGYLSIDEIETPRGRYTRVPGGAALYAALGARHGGAQVALCACVGEDYPQSWLDALLELEIDIAEVHRQPGPSRTASIRYGQSGQRSSAHHLQTQWWQRTAALAPQIPISLRNADLIVACPMPVEQLDGLLDRAKHHNLDVVADTSEAFALASGADFASRLVRLAVFAPSREETRLLLPELGDDEAAIELASMGPDVLQKRGADGAFAVAAGATHGVLVPAPTDIVVCDPTGAGDAVVGSLAAHLALGHLFFEAISPALLSGSLAVTGIGPSALGFPVAAADIELRPA